MSVRNLKIVPFVLATFIPVAAFADDGTTVSSAQQDCIDKCLSDGTSADATTTTTPTTTPVKAKKAKKASSGTVATTETPSTATSSSSTTVIMPPDQASLDSIRAEERARAAEEFNADQQAAYQAHQADIEKARAEERAAAETDANKQLSAERMRYESALADERAKQEKIANALVTPAGVYGFLGGGATNFTQPDATSGTGVGGYWDARVGVGTRSILGAEVGYTGSARDVTALGVGSDAWLMSNGVEGVARLNVPLTPGEEGKVLVEPYTFGGIGWNRYNVVSDVSLSADLSNEDDVLTVPMGLGMAFGFSGVTLDTRATYRQAIGSDLFGNETSSFGEASLNGWSAGAALGFEF